MIEEISEQEREYVVRLTARFRGCNTIVHASSLTEAREKVSSGTFDSDVSTNTAEIIDWSIISIEENS